MITAYKKDEAKAFLRSEDSGLLMELSEYFTFYAEGYKFMPAYRNKLWDGKIRLFDSRSQTIPFGLMKRVAEFCQERGYKLVYDESMKTNKFFEKNDLEKFINDSTISLGDKLIEPRDYQFDAFTHGIQNRRAILISPTGSGKSLIIYMMMRHYLSHEMDKKVLVVVPTTSLVEQM